MAATTDIVIQISTTGVTPTYVGRATFVMPLGTPVSASGKNVKSQIPITTLESLYTNRWVHQSGYY